MRIAIAQADFPVGAIEQNTQRVIDLALLARDQHQADVIVFPELTLTGYPPEDLLLRSSLSLRIDRARQQLAAGISSITVVLGFPDVVDGKLFNVAGVLHDGQWLGVYHKQELPNYQVFDEKRYFSAGDAALIVPIAGVMTAITICEDVWHEAPMRQAREGGAGLMLNLNASPFHAGKRHLREQVLSARAQQGAMPVVYANLVGGQDELVFDGGSMAVNSDGSLAFAAPEHEEGVYLLELEALSASLSIKPSTVAPALTEEEAVYRALVRGVRDYVGKNGFKGVALGLSGGIDSALVLAIAVDALGPERVTAVMMPFHYTSEMSLEDAEAEARALQVHYKVIPVAPMFDAFMATLTPHFAGTARDKTEENLQARIRGVLLMALSNKQGSLVLTTGNKSEMAVGYATLYGDMAGGFDVLKDVYKTLVFRLARWRNQQAVAQGIEPPIPERVITRPPSAELAPGQKDEDSLPPYEVLDGLLQAYIEQDLSAEAIVAQGFARDVVYRVLRMVDLNEYKRRQAAIGPRVTPRGFGRDRRYPVTNAWPIGE